MADWQYTLNLKDLWDKYSDNPSPPYPEEGRIIAGRIRNAPFFGEFEDALEEITYLFKDVDSRGDFDSACEELWDWGDIPLPTLPGKMQRKNCWIKTF